MSLFDFFRHSPTTITAATVPRVGNTATSRPPYESGSRSGHRGAAWPAPEYSPNMATASAATIRNRCRDAYRNDSWAKAIVDVFVDDCVGWGVKPLSRATDETFRQRVQRLFEKWTAAADADGVLDFAGLQAQAVRTLALDGEVFIRLRRRKLEDGLPVPLQIQVLPAEICPEDLNSQTADTIIKSGIEYDQIGRVVAFHMRETIPGEDDYSHSSATLHRVPADQVLHVFEPSRPGQRRGVSMLAAGLVRLAELDKYQDAVLMRQQLSNMFLATRKPPTGGENAGDFDPLTGERVSDRAANDTPVSRLAPGTVQDLDPGEELTFNEPPDPPAGYADYVKHELRAAGATMGIPLEIFTGDWTGQNDRLARVTLLQYRRRVLRFIWTVLAPQLLTPLWREWFRLAFLTPGALPTPTGEDADRVVWTPHSWPYLHPVQDVSAFREAVRAGLTSRAAAVSETGEDAEVIDAQVARDNKRADALGLRYDSDGRTTKGGGQ